MNEQEFKENFSISLSNFLLNILQRLNNIKDPNELEGLIRNESEKLSVSIIDYVKTSQEMAIEQAAQNEEQEIIEGQKQREGTISANEQKRRDGI